MNDDTASQIDGMELIDKTQNAVIEAVDSVSGLIAETAETTETPTHEHEIFYKSAEFWVGFAFILVVVALAKPISRLLKGMLTKRRDEISERINQAEKLHDDAQKLLAEYERKYVHAEEEADIVLQKANRQIENVRTEELKKLESELKQKQKDADGIISSVKAKTEAEINSKTAKQAIKTAYLYLKENISPEQHAKLIDESIKNITEKLSQ